jgi:hypothetical protein
MNSPFSNRKPSVSTEEGIKAALTAIRLGDNNGVHSAICGGLSMHLYGFTRATQDVDLIADDILPIAFVKDLSFGGRSYLVPIDGKEIEVDWIVRNDDLSDLYLAALRDKIYTEDQLPIISPEWLVILKHLAGRGKDHIDCVWLLRQDHLVNRELMISKIREFMGKHAFWAIKDLESLILEADLLKAKDERNDK